MNRLNLVFAFGLTLLLAATVHAQQDSDRESRARELFAVGQYAEALEIYGKLYAETTHPTYMRNIGRCYQNLGQPEKAISSFREYLRQAKDLTADQRAQVESYIREMEDLQRSRAAPPAPAALPPAAPAAAAPAPAALPPPSSASAPPPSTVRLTTEAPAGGAVDRDATSSSGGTTRIAGIALGGVGLVGAGIGVAYFLKSSHTNDSAKALCPALVCKDDDERNTHNQLVADAKHQQNIAIIATAIGAAALVGGGTLVILSSSDRHEATAQLAPWLGDHGGGVLAVGRF